VRTPPRTPSGEFPSSQFLSGEFPSSEFLSAEGSSLHEMMPTSAMIACPDCDALQGLPVPPGREAAVCYRCAALLVGAGGDRLDRALAFTLGAIPLFIVANTFPLLKIETAGNMAEATLLESVRALYVQQAPLAMLVLFTTIILPTLQLGSLAYLLLWLKRRRLPPALSPVFRLFEGTRPWSQIGILLLGVLVAYGKLITIFQVVPGIGLWAMMGFLILFTSVSTSVDGRRFWDRVAMARLKLPRRFRIL
jgi:paraquat-inducible protein A